MELTNATGMAAAVAMGIETDGREAVFVVVKGTFGLDGKPHAQSAPMFEADVAWGEPGLSPPRYESDFVLRKPKCDVLLNGTAYAEKPAARTTVGLRIGNWAKRFDVVGTRTWRSPEPQPFTRMPISYANAWGGPACSENPVGIGMDAEGALPCTEEHETPVSSPNGSYRPMAFGPLGRGWKPRPDFAGTYDEKWRQERCPLLPPDFDERYYQSAPPDQQIAPPKGGEEIVLENLTPAGRTTIRMPEIRVPVEFYLKREPSRAVESTVDTILLEPDQERFTVVWRAALALRQNVFEIVQIVVGRKSRGWYRAIECGKRYLPSLRHV